MKRRLYIWTLLAVFLTATTGFTIQQCCCDKNPKKTCCSRPDTKGCKTDVTYHKMQSDLQLVTKAETSFATLLHTVLLFCCDFHQGVSDHVVLIDDSGPPDLALSTLSRLQVFRI